MTAPTKAEFERRIAAIEEALREGFAPRGVPGPKGSCFNEAARRLKMSRGSLRETLYHPDCPRQPDWSIYVPPPPKPRVSDTEALRRVEAIEDALREGYSPSGRTSAYSKGSAMARAAARIGVGRNTLRETLLQPNCPRQPDWELYEEPLPDKVEMDDAKPIVSGWKKQRPVPWANPSGRRSVYVLTSAQNNTHIHEAFWLNLLTYADHLGAKVLVSRFTYDKASYGKGSVKPGKEPTKEDMRGLWYDPAIAEHVSDERVRLAPDLIWCGEMNILPTATRPLSRLHTYSGADSAVIPHVKIAMESIAQMKGTPAKMLYTTGSVTQRNYIQKKSGLVAEFHHCFAALLVEVDEKGDWFARQINADDDGNFQDLDAVVEDQEVSVGNPVEAVVWGDVHCDQLNQDVADLCWGDGGILDELRPKHQLLHDLLDFRSRNHHDSKNPHKRFKRFVEHRENVEAEVRRSAEFVNRRAHREWCATVVADSNHDEALERWLREGDYRMDPVNSIFFLDLQLAKYRAMRAGEEDFHVYEEAMRRVGANPATRFLRVDESYPVAGIEHGMHGHLGPNGARGNPQNLSRIGHKANVGHSHSAGIHDGLYIAGVMGRLRQEYNVGPSSWSHSLIVTYPSGKRTVITLRNGKWKM